MNGYIVYADGKRVSSLVSYSVAADIAAQCMAGRRKNVTIQQSL